jgi:hypothetical protein
MFFALLKLTSPYNYLGFACSFLIDKIRMKIRLILPLITVHLQIFVFCSHALLFPPLNGV